MRMEDIAPEARERVRKLRSRLCEQAVQYKSVLPERCQACESPCGYGMELLDVLGMEKPENLRTAGKGFIRTGGCGKSSRG